MKYLLATLALAVLFVAINCTVNIAININAANCGANSGSSSNLLPATNCDQPNCSWCLSNCSSYCKSSCQCNEEKCLVNQTRYQFYGQLYTNQVLKGYIELIVNDLTDIIYLHGTYFSFAQNGFGLVTFNKIGTNTNSTLVLNISSSFGANSIRPPGISGPRAFVITREQLKYLTSTGVVQATITFPTTNPVQVQTTVLQITRTQPVDSIYPLLLNNTHFVVSECRQFSIATANNFCTQNNAVLVDIEAHDECVSSQARFICYKGLGIEFFSDAKFTPCNYDTPINACLTLFPGTAAESVFETSINCLNQNLDGGKRYLCVKPPAKK